MCAVIVCACSLFEPALRPRARARARATPRPPRAACHLKVHPRARRLQYNLCGALRACLPEPPPHPTTVATAAAAAHSANMAAISAAAAAAASAAEQLQKPSSPALNKGRSMRVLGPLKNA